MGQNASSRGALVSAIASSCLLLGCELAYPEVVIINLIDEQVLVSEASFNGCKWEENIAYGEATTPGNCLPGEDSVHFKKFDGQAFLAEQTDQELPGSEPTWFNYKTVSVKHVTYGSFHVFELTADDIEQDFSVPGPYGH
jgi:hypothetical protein